MTFPRSRPGTPAATVKSGWLAFALDAVLQSFLGRFALGAMATGLLAQTAGAQGFPAATTGAATAITSMSATLNGSVNPNLLSTTVTFQYGLTTSYTSMATATQSPLAAGSTAMAVSAGISGLAPTTTYHFRVLATNAAGSSVGSDGTFTTPSNVSTLSNLVLSAGTISFNSNTVSYSTSVPNATASLTVTPTRTQANATIKVNGTTVVSGSPSNPISLSVGSTTTIVIQCTAQDGTTSTTYFVNVTRLNPPPAGLAYAVNPATYTKGTAITANTVTNTGGPATWSVAPALPAGLSLNTSTGAISGTPTAVAAAAAYTVTATNNGGSANVAVTITVKDVAPSALTYATNPATYTIGTAITANPPTISGGAVAAWSVSPPLPAGLTFSPSTGVISGTPTVIIASAAYTVTATNSGGFTTAAVTIAVQGIPPAFSSGPSAIFTVGSSGSFTVAATGTPAPTFTFTGTLPNGMTLTSAGLLSGTPTVGGIFPITITAANGTPPNATQSFTLTVNQAPAITSAGTVTFTVGSLGSFQVAATGSPAPAFSASGALLSGVTFTTAGLLSGAPAADAGGSYPLIINASNGVAPDATQSFTLVINRPPVAGNDTLATTRGTPVSLPAARLLLNDSDPDGDPISVSLPATSTGQGGVVALTGGTLTYTPPNGTFTGIDTFAYAVSDGRGGMATATVTVTVSAPSGTSSNLAGITIEPGVGARIRWQGIVGRAYQIQSADSAGGPWQNFPGTVTASSTGVIEYLDTTQPPPTQRFFRTISAP